MPLILWLLDVGKTHSFVADNLNKGYKSHMRRVSNIPTNLQKLDVRAAASHM